MNQRPWLTAALWLSVPTAINIPLLWDRGGTRLLGLAVLLAIIALNAILLPAASVAKTRLLYRQKLEDHCDIAPLIMVAVMVILITTCVFRALGVAFTLSNVVANSGLYILTPLALILSFIQAETKENKLFILYAMLLSTPVYVAANVVLFAAGFTGPGEAVNEMADERMNQTLGLIGITATRVAFPITSGVNGFGVVAATSALVCFFTSVYSKGLVRFVGMSLLPVTMAAIVLTDARGSALSAVMMGLVTLVVLKVPKLLKLNFILIAVTPFVPSIGYRFFELANNGTLLSFMIRPGAQGARLGLGTGRGEIWKSILNYFSDFEWLHLIGYGAYGQVSSGASKSYSWVFNEFGVSMANCHNAFLQYLLDGGYVGAAAWLTFLIVLTVQGDKVLRSAGVPRAAKAVLTSIPLLTVAASQTEVFGTIYTPEVLLFVMSALVATAFVTRTSVVPRTTKKEQRIRAFAPTMVYAGPDVEQSHP